MPEHRSANRPRTAEHARLADQAHLLLAALTCLRRAEAGHPVTRTAPDGSTGPEAILAYWRRQVAHAAATLATCLAE